MNELKNIVQLFSDVELPIYSSVDMDYAETDVASLQCISEFVNLGNMIHDDYQMYINEDDDIVIIDKIGMEYLGYWR